MDLTETEPAIAQLEMLLAPPDVDLNKPRTHWLQFFPPRTIEWNRVVLPVEGLSGALAGLRVLHLSDFHLRRRWPIVLDLLLERISENPPDLVLLTGDFVDSKRNYRPAMPMVRRLVEGLKARIGCFAIHGNHDNYQIGVELADSPVTFLDERRHVVDVRGTKIELIGLPGKHRRELTPEFLASLPEPHQGVLRIVLSHFPDHLKRTNGGLGADLFLSGHTHGGQICLSGGIPILWHDSLPRKLARGAHRVGKTWLVVSRGLGYTGLPIRAHATPEVVEIELAAA